jgi:uncharacterized protein YgbK (DUF1537 family)
VLDDDPTGTQAVSDVDVILQPSLRAFQAFLAGPARAAFVLTNSRSLNRQLAVALLKRLSDQIAESAKREATQVAIVLRGDSTLRGHVFAEMDVFARPDSAFLFVPAFPGAGRTTVNGIHYVTVEARRIPVGLSEFARDATFRFRSSRLVEWVAEVANRQGVSIPLTQIRSQGPPAVSSALMRVPPGVVVLPDAETWEDIEIIVAGLLAAEAMGRHVVVRSAAPLAAIRAGCRPKQLQASDLPRCQSTLVVCGSHTEASTGQVLALEKALGAATILEVEPNSQIDRSSQHRIAAEVSRRLAERGCALLMTPRTVCHSEDALGTGAVIMNALCDVVEQVAGTCDAIVAKGGITSASVATRGLGATSARVLGQVETGVAVWKLSVPRSRDLPYVVVPGNVGDNGTLVRIAKAFGVSLQDVPVG